jgi:DNA-binding MarR family transcriptional regulator
MVSAGSEQVGQVRSFSRTVSQRVGALNQRFLGRGRPLGEARVLWEIGIEGCEVRSLRSRLGLDSGHTSRLLRALEADGLVRVEQSPADRRVRVARLTAAGLAERALLDRRGEEVAASILAPLDPGQRDELLSAMRTVERLLMGPAVELRIVDPAGADAKRCVRAYFGELNRRSESGFDPAAGISAEPHELVPPAGAFLVAYVHDEPIGCGGVKHHAGAPSEIKRMWVAESARGLGIGRRLLQELEARAAHSGATVARLETNRALVEAIALYRSAGYVEVPSFNDEPFADHWFEKRLD